MRTDFYADITDKIVQMLESGVRPWAKSWTSAEVSRPLRHTGEPYQGVNVLVLWAESITKGYTSPFWMTFKQATEYGAFVKKGEKGTVVVYANRFTKTETDANGDEVEKTIPFLKAYYVFNAGQIEGLPAKFSQLTMKRSPVEINATAAAFVAQTGAIIKHGGNKAYYSPVLDYIQLPAPEAFRDGASYHSTEAHELTHWTGHATRLDRLLDKRFGSDAYAAEELIAELGAAFLCADWGISAEPRPDHASYLKSWISVMKADKKAIFTAAAHAQKATDYLHSLQGVSAEKAS